MGGSDQLNERQINAADLHGQQQFIRLFVANQRRVHAFIRTLVPNTADADDILQETSITGLAKFSTPSCATNASAGKSAWKSSSPGSARSRGTRH